MRSNSKSKLVFLIFFAGLQSLLANTIYVTTDYVHKIKPIYVMLHDTDGKEIITKKITAKHYKKGVELDYDAALESKDLVLSIFRETKIKEELRLMNFSYVGLCDGYVLEYKDAKSSFWSYHVSHRLQLYNWKTLEGIEWESSTILKKDRSGNEFLEKRVLETLEHPLYVEFRNEANGQTYYFLDTTNTDRQGYPVITLFCDDFKQVDRFHTIECSRKDVEYVDLRLYTPSLDYPILITRQAKDGLIEIPILEGINYKRLDFKIQFSSVETERAGCYAEYYYSTDKLIDEIVVPDFIESHIEISDNTYKINANTDYDFYELSHLYVKEAKVVSWLYYSFLVNEVSVHHPALPAKLAKRYPIVSSDYLRTLNYKLFIPLEKRDVNDLPNIMNVSAADNLVKNKTYIFSKVEGYKKKDD